MAILRNNTGRRQVFELPHEVVCTDDKCHCLSMVQGRRITNPETGETGVQSDDVRVPNSVHIPARGRSAELPDEVTEIPRVADAIARGLLSVE